jgi:hypothetical protein
MVAKFPWEGDVGVSSIAQITALAKSSGVAFSISSAYRSGDPGFHGKHNAIDMVTSRDNMRELAAYLYQYSPYLLELIHSNGPYFVKRGIRGYHYSDSVVAGHWDHVHCAATLSGLKAAAAGDLVIPSGQAQQVSTKPTITGCLPTAVLAAAPIIIGGATWLTQR